MGVMRVERMMWRELGVMGGVMRSRGERGGGMEVETVRRDLKKSEMGEPGVRDGVLARAKKARPRGEMGSFSTERSMGWVSSWLGWEGGGGMRGMGAGARLATVLTRWTMALSSAPEAA